MFREVKKIADILVCSFRMTVKAQYQYKVNFWLRFVVMFITYFSEFLSTWFLITKFNSVGEWKREDIMLTYGLATLAYALSRFFFAGFNGVSRQLKDGSFYLKMLRPMMKNLSCSFRVCRWTAWARWCLEQGFWSMPV